MPVEVNRDNYDDEVTASKIPVLVDFWGPRCRPCLNLMPAVEELEKEYGNKLKVAKLNAEQNRMLCAKLRVMGLPTFLLYSDGAEVKRISGEGISKSDLKEAIDEVLG